ncbi:MAG: polysaccharide deacetylase family protein [Sandaracinaceae bacterium]
MRLASVSVDLDEVPCYAAIHGLEAPSDEAARAIYRRALPRLRRFFDEHGVVGSFFAIGRDIDAENADRLRALVADGHEVGNHTQNHLYDLTRRDEATWEREVGQAQRVLQDATGERPEGFRAPGYTVVDGLLDVLPGQGLRYDSSVFPCPGYYGLKALARGAIRIAGRRSQSVLDDPRVLLAPADPYRVGRPYRRRGAGIVELPIGVTRGARLPYIGTSVVLSGRTGAALLTRSIVGRPFVNLELHGIDLADAEDDGLRWLAPHQPDLRRRARDKAAALASALEVLRGAGYRFVPLREVASRVEP